MQRLLSKEQPMPKRAKLLYALHSADIQLARKGRRYKSVEANLGESEALLQARAKLETATQQHTHWRDILRERDLEAQRLADKLSTEGERLYGGRITNPKELGDIQREIEYLKRRQTDLEDQQLEAMIALEEATTQLAIANEEYVVVEATWKSENAELHQEYETLRQELAQLMAQRKQLFQAISEKDRSEYASLQRLRKGQAVALVQQGRCTTCNVSVPKHDLERAANTNEIVHCSGCDRILYVPEGS
jgi:predicted  nucleic acid-binding Zn-ribbon protein